MQRALVEVLVLAVLCGVVSTVVFLRRLAFVADALTHTMFPGVAIAFFLGESLFIGALAAAVVSTVLLALLARQRRLDPDAVLALLIAAFFSLGVVVVSRRTSYQSDLTTLLFGRLLTVDAATIVQTAAVAAARARDPRRPRQGGAADVVRPRQRPRPRLPGGAARRRRQRVRGARHRGRRPRRRHRAGRGVAGDPGRGGPPRDAADPHDGRLLRRASSPSPATSGSSCPTSCRCTTTCGWRPGATISVLLTVGFLVALAARAVVGRRSA